MITPILEYWRIAQHRLQRSLGRVVPQTEIPGGDAAFRLDRGGFDTQQAGARQRHAAQVEQVPGRRPALFGDVLAHRRDDDAVGQGQAAQVDRGKQDAHEGAPTGDGEFFGDRYQLAVLPPLTRMTWPVM